MAKHPVLAPKQPAERAAERPWKAFVWGTELLIAVLGVIAIVGPEADQVIVTKVLGAMLMLVAFLGLFIGVLNPDGPGRRLPIVSWAFIAFATGAVVQWVPGPGIPSLGTVAGFLLVGHGLSATTLAVRHRGLSRMAMAGLGLAAILLLLTGLAFVFGKDAGDRVDEIVLGVDIVLFGASLIVGRLLIEARSPTPTEPYT